MSRREPSVLITRALVKSWRFPTPQHGDKEDRGCVLVIGGARELPGAVMLAATNALRTGAGKLQIATDPTIAQAVATLIPEALVTTLSLAKIRPLAEKADAILIGPGLAAGTPTTKLVRTLLSRQRGKTVVLDAEALHSFRRNADWLKRAGVEAIVTPHAGEMAEMTGMSKSKVERDPQTTALEFAKQSGTITVLKGSETFIATPGGKIFRNTRGNAGLATSGSGDCLAGIIAGLVARGMPALQAAASGVHLHACAGESLAKKIGPIGYLAREIAAEIPRLLKLSHGN